MPNKVLSMKNFFQTKQNIFVPKSAGLGNEMKTAPVNPGNGNTRKNLANGSEHRPAKRVENTEGSVAAEHNKRIQIHLLQNVTDHQASPFCKARRITRVRGRSQYRPPIGAKSTSIRLGNLPQGKFVPASIHHKTRPNRRKVRNRTSRQIDLSRKMLRQRRRARRNPAKRRTKNLPRGPRNIVLRLAIEQPYRQSPQDQVGNKTAANGIQSIASKRSLMHRHAMHVQMAALHSPPHRRISRRVNDRRIRIQSRQRLEFRANISPQSRISLQIHKIHIARVSKQPLDGPSRITRRNMASLSVDNGKRRRSLSDTDMRPDSVRRKLRTNFQRASQIVSQSDNFHSSRPHAPAIARKYRSTERATHSFPSCITFRFHQAPKIRSKENGSTAAAIRRTFSAFSGM
jgi:hypothetical protein